jgi:DNA-binding IclR family transcriptional regulator
MLQADLTVLHYIVLGQLRTAATADDIAERLDCPVATVVALLEDLVSAGYVRPAVLQ